MLKLIVNGDDLGLSVNINNAIEKSYCNGILTSASLMANSNYFDHAVKILESNPSLDAGIHLSLTGGKPLLSYDSIPSLINQNGNFYNNAIEFTNHYLLGKISLSDIRRELTAQVTKILDYRISVSHIDSHQHLHILPQIFDITYQLAKDYKIKFIRKPSEKISPYMFKYIRLYPRLLQLTSLQLLSYLSQKKMPFEVDLFRGFYFGGRLNKTNILTIISHLPEKGLCELMCHPGMLSESDKSLHSNYRHDDELLALIDGDVKQMLIKNRIQLINFKGLVSNTSW